MAQRQDLEVQRRTRPDQTSEHGQTGNQDRHHCDHSLPIALGKFNFDDKYGVVVRHSTGQALNRDIRELAKRGRFRQKPPHFTVHDVATSEGEPMKSGSVRSICRRASPFEIAAGVETKRAIQSAIASSAAVGDAGRSVNAFLSRLVYMHLPVPWRERGNLARVVRQSIGGLEVFVAARAPETAIRVDNQWMADAATEDARTICPDMDMTGPRAFGGESGHCALDFSDKVLEESSAIIRRCSERFGDRCLNMASAGEQRTPDWRLARRIDRRMTPAASPSNDFSREGRKNQISRSGHCAQHRAVPRRTHRIGVRLGGFMFFTLCYVTLRWEPYVPWARPLQNVELMALSEDLQLQSGPIAERRSQSR
jgi:hypothetical protein